jgi:hypothetical protein
MPSPATIKLVKLESPPRKLSEGVDKNNIVTGTYGPLILEYVNVVCRQNTSVYSDYSRVSGGRNECFPGFINAFSAF